MESSEIFALIGGIVAVLFGGGGLIAFFRVRPENRRTHAMTDQIVAETDHTVGETWQAMYGTLAAELSITRDLLAETRLSMVGIREREEHCRVELVDLHEKYGRLQAEHESTALALDSAHESLRALQSQVDVLLGDRDDKAS